MEHGTTACLYKQMKEFSGSITAIVHACGSHEVSDKIRLIFIENQQCSFSYHEHTCHFFSLQNLSKYFISYRAGCFSLSLHTYIHFARYVES
jgi:predicted HAD superfamily hydrolase